MLEARNIVKSYASAEGPTPVLRDVSLTLEQGEIGRAHV